MKLTIESTREITTIDGVRCRIWKVLAGEGDPAAPADVTAYVARIQVPVEADTSAFERELREVSMHVQRAVFDLRSVL